MRVRVVGDERRGWKKGGKGGGGEGGTLGAWLL